VRALIIGAGAVGLVYGKHLADGGAQVSLYVRPSRREEAIAGYDLTRVRLVRKRRVSRFVPASVVTSAEEAALLDVDQAWVATSTGALDEPWLSELLTAMPRATVVFLQPGGDALARMQALVPDDGRRVRGAITMASWSTPLEGSIDVRETRGRPGIAYLLPPLSPSGLEGKRAAEIAASLSRGGCPASVANVTTTLAVGSAVLLPHIVALEAGGWRFDRLASRELAKLAATASREALAIACDGLRIGQPLLLRLFVRALTTQIAARLARLATPFDLEVYLRVHFLKVRAQTIQLIAEHVRDGRARALPTTSLEALRARVP
jgi:hypothetical protein